MFDDEIMNRGFISFFDQFLIRADILDVYKRQLYTRSKKRGDVRRAMEILVYHGANPAILVEAHPHVGTDKLPGVIVNIRKTIQKQGGEIRFGCRVTGLIIRENSIQAVSYTHLDVYKRQPVILARMPSGS